MRDILFKAKRIDNGEWVEGNLVFLFPKKVHEAFIIPIKFGNAFMQLREGDLGFRCWYKVDKETICQFTGLYDKNGNKIWENDIVTCQTRYGGDIGKVVFHNGKFCVLWNSTYHYSRNGKCENYYDINAKNSVKGNVFDNPELLQEESDE
jgi:uncharacterized phage protein (TIGR01671 family)